MIHISDITKRIDTFLEEKGIEKYKIFVRVNFQIDVYIVAPQYEEALGYQDEFLSLLTEVDLDDNGNENKIKPKNEFDLFYINNAKELKLKFYIIRVEEAQEDPYYSSIFTNSDVVIDWGPRYRFNSLLEPYEIPETFEKSSKRAPVVTFYSYKGGMGRTTTMIAYAIHSAVNSNPSKKKRVVIIDCDLEAPGYLNFFNLKDYDGLVSGKKNGLVEFICDAQFTAHPENLEITDYIINIGNEVSIGKDNSNNFVYDNFENIWLVPAGNLNESYKDYEDGNRDRNDYLEGLAKINLSSVQSVVGYFNLLFEKINETIEPDLILIDSRTGFNDIFGTAALYLSSCVVGFFGFSRQTQPGLMNLINAYYNTHNNFKLQLVFSILPEIIDENWLETQVGQVRGYINYRSNETKDYPSFSYLRRNVLLEKLGSGDEQTEEAFVKLVTNREYDSYNELFDRIDEQLFARMEESPLKQNQEGIITETPDTDTSVVEGITCSSEFSSNTPALVLRNVVLRHLKRVLADVKNFAEDTKIVEEQFFYRDCMKELFDKKKFIIQGYKGTGKTYLYKALANEKISTNIQKWILSDNQKNNTVGDEEIKDTIFLNVLPPNEVSMVFDNINYGSVDEPEYYFNVFWQIYTWNAILLLPEFESIKNESKLKDFVLPLVGAGNAKEAYARINTLIKQGVDTQIIIEKDIIKLNDYLRASNKTLFVLYDRLDTCINPLHWNKAVSPLINYWRNNHVSFSNIVPKIFVRTDLFRQIEGTNTARLENNIIHIEWTIGEVFGYFFKLIFSDKTASDAYWTIAEKIGINENYIKNTKISFEKFPENQFKSMQKGEMNLIITVFFGKQVNVGAARLGDPWAYFGNELANADNTAISLRPFINTLDKNAVEKALAKTERWVHEIISPEIYASRAVREKTTEQYFYDLTQDAFSKDLLRFKEVIRSSNGKKYQYKSLDETLFDELIETTYGKICDGGGSSVVKSTGDLKQLIFANGIMAEKITTKGKYYRFAPIYWYSWGLANSVLENEEKRRMKKDGYSLIEDEIYEGEIGINEYGRKCIFIDRPPFKLVYDNSVHDYEIGSKVQFEIRIKPNLKNPSKPFFDAINIQLIG